MNATKGPYIERCPHDKENPYAQTSRALIRDPNLHPSVCWMLIYLLSMKDGWKITPTQIINHVKGHKYCGRDMVYKWIKEACEAGYMKKEEWLDGNLKRCRYLLSEYPKFKKSFPDPGSQDPQTKDYKKEHKKKKENTLKGVKEKDSPRAQTPRGAASRTATTSQITFNKETRAFEGITEEDIKAWKSKFPALNMRHEIELCSEWALTSFRKNYRKSLLAWFGNVTKNRTTPFIPSETTKVEVSQEVFEKNKQKAELWELQAEKKGRVQHYAIHATATKISFVMPNNAGYEVNYENSEKEFEKKCRNALIRMKLITS